MDRRTFMQTASLAGMMPAPAAPADGIRLGFDTFSIRAFEWRAIRLLDYAAGLKLDSVQLSSLKDYESLDPAYLQKVKDHSTRVGVSIDGGIGCICPSSRNWNANDGTPEEYARKGLRVSKAVGSSLMRCYLGSRADRTSQLPLEAHMENTVKVLRAVRSEAMDLGVKIAIENHAGDMQAREVKMLIEAAGKEFAGACLDTGNPMWVAEDPMLTLETLGPYVLTTHIRDSAVFETPRGAATQWVALGDGCSIDFPKFLALYRQICPGAVMQLEIITGRPPDELAYLEPNFWKAFPKTPAWEFSRFVKLAKQGRPYLGPMVIGGAGKQPPAIEAALKEQQRTDLERSFEYAKKTLGLGLKKA